MSLITRRTIYCLLITLVINAGGWTFNKDAVADVWFGEQRSLAVGDDYSSVKSAAAQTDALKIPCNHWCHAIGNFVGLLSQSTPVTHAFAGEYSTRQSITIQFYSPDSRFRPPRFFF